MEDFFGKWGIYYRYKKTNPRRATLVFIHGVSGSSSAWLDYEKEFHGEYNTLSIDLRGHGRSFKYKKYEEYALERFSQDLYELLIHVGIEKCVLISHSFGCLVALEFIARHEDMVSGVIFISPHFAVGKMFLARLLRPLLSFAVSIKPSLLSSPPSGGHVDYSKYKNTGDWNMRRSFADINNTGFWIYLYTTAQSYVFDGEAILKKIKVPTLVVHGARDTIFPLKYGILTAKNVMNAKFIVLNDVGHIIVLNKKNELTEAIVHFLGGRGGRD